MLVAKGRRVFVTEDLLTTTGDSRVPQLPDEMKCEAHSATYEAFLPEGYPNLETPARSNFQLTENVRNEGARWIANHESALRIQNVRRCAKQLV